MKVDLIYFTYNRLDHTRITLPVLLEHSGYPFALTIVDNGSRDGTVTYLLDTVRQYSEHMPVKLIRNRCNMGLSQPTNEFWERSEADLVGKIDNDILVETDWLKKLVDAHKQLPRLAAAGGMHFPLEVIETKRLLRNVVEQGRIRLVRQPYIGGNYVAKLSVLRKYGKLNEEIDASGLKIGGWTGYQKRLTADGYLIGYYYPFIIFKHLHNAPNSYFKKVRGMSKKKYIRWEKQDGQFLIHFEWQWGKEK